ncbi:uncharacterized protein PV09_02879 [Verruconis gallopava]|uniref:Sec39 domain-containing protein n=1 Tax=Verruconis gallopava TaxID=253628 RepID=A0A0D1Z0E1_9PEZI|nr:uncharacterized protein PV09_02879 [Verruconis gallopava]KIW06432.1 hypothetical protein PV09_02879 [Verruconis gallopava]
MASETLLNLSTDHCVLLAATYASESNLDALRLLLQYRRDAFEPELALRLILTYLPETVDPVLYTPLVAEILGVAPQEQDGAEQPSPNIQLDTSSVNELSDAKAHKLAKHLRLLPLDHSSFPAAACDDLAGRFLIHKAHRIAEAGILTLLPQLLDPFLDDRPFLKAWFISTVLPLLRFSYEYYADNVGEATWSLEQLENANVEQALEMLLSRSLSDTEHGQSMLARDMKYLVGPWMYGTSSRKRRKLSGRIRTRERRSSVQNTDSQSHGDDLEDDGMSEEQRRRNLKNEWDSALRWLSRAAAKNLQAVADAVQGWDGPGDVDLGGYESNAYLDDEDQGELEARYAQTVFAAVYAADDGSKPTIRYAHSLLVRIANLMEFDPPPELSAAGEAMPVIENAKGILKDLPNSGALQLDSLLNEKSLLTKPTKEAFALLELLVLSSQVFLELSNRLSVIAVARIRFQYDADEQLAIVKKVLHTLGATSKMDDADWAAVRSRLIWLWGWGLPRDDEEDELGNGVFNRIERGRLEGEILGALLNAGAYSLAAQAYIEELSPLTCLTVKDVEAVILKTALHHYDNASNGNRTRSGVKKASDIVTTFRKYFPASDALTRCEALLAATHALSFYKLTLQHGVPFQPVNIRVSNDPVSLIEKVLAQNPRSYTKLDDLIGIATNLVASGIGQDALAEFEVSTRRRESPEQVAAAKLKAERRVIGMSIEAALEEDDFETAYSYVVNRLTAMNQPGARSFETDDISWRAALAAGRHKSSSSSISASTNIATPPKLRRLEQRMELLSQTLLLAPSNALPEVLNVWRKCEEEMRVLQAAESAEEQAFNVRAEQQGVPGAFVNTTDAGTFVQPRREVGRGGREEAPVGLFDVARGAAAAFSRTAFPLRGHAGGSSRPGGFGNRGPEHTRHVSAAGSEGDGKDGEGRIRKRDMVANVVTGGLASGIGWVIGATPVDRQQR